MNTEIIKAEDYGLEVAKANELTVGLNVTKEERALLIQELDIVSKLELTEENLPKFKELRLKIVKNRTQGINKWHKANKDFFLTGGRFVDAIKNKEVQINEQMESKLMDAEKHFENLEKERVAALQQKRVVLLMPYVEDAAERDLATMDEDVWESYFNTKKESFEAQQKAAEEAEKERLAKIQAEKEEQERIRLENEELRKQAIERERLAKIEEDKRITQQAKIDAAHELELNKIRKENERLAEIQAKKRAEERRIEMEKATAERVKQENILIKERESREKLQTELKAKEDAEARAKEEKEKALQVELNKGDAEKVKDLIADLQSLTTKYTFKSAKNNKMYVDVNVLIVKVINFIEK